jgi:hypothetical protein
VTAASLRKPPCGIHETETRTKSPPGSGSRAEKTGLNQKHRLLYSTSPLTILSSALPSFASSPLKCVRMAMYVCVHVHDTFSLCSLSLCLQVGAILSGLFSHAARHAQGEVTRADLPLNGWLGRTPVVRPDWVLGRVERT